MRLFLRQLGALVRLSFLDLYRRKDLVTVGALALALLVPLAALRPFGVAGADRYVGEVAMGLIWLFSLVIAIALGARQFPPEFESRTIYPLFARPVGRSTVLLGKYLGAFLAAVSATALFYVLFAVYRTVAGLRPPRLCAGRSRRAFDDAVTRRHDEREPRVLRDSRLRNVHMGRQASGTRGQLAAPGEDRP